MRLARPFHTVIAFVFIGSMTGCDRTIVSKTASPDNQYEATVVATHEGFRQVDEVYLGEKGNPRGMLVARLAASHALLNNMQVTVSWSDQRHLLLVCQHVGRVSDQKPVLFVGDGQFNVLIKH